MNQRLPDDDAGDPANDDAAHWMARKLSGSMNAEERKAFEGWLSLSDDHRRAFAELEGMLDRADAHGGDLLAAEFERQLTDEAERQARHRRSGVSRIAAAISAAALVAVISIFAVNQQPDRLIAHETEIGAFDRIALDDGSEIELNTASRITVAFDDNSRSVNLEGGEAFFNVETDRARPFIVKTDVAEIAVTGTSFSVSTVHDRSSVHVLTGVVEVTPLKGQQATLLAGDTIDVKADGSATPVARYDPSLIFAWRSGKARFHDERLGNVVASLNRYFDTPIELGDDSLADLPVTGEFDIRDRETAVKALTLIFDLESREEPARIILSRPQPQ